MGTQLDLDDVAADHPLALHELAALRKDAERYRWIRNEAGDDAAEMDRAIDSARLLVLPNVRGEQEPAHDQA